MVKPQSEGAQIGTSSSFSHWFFINNSFLEPIARSKSHKKKNFAFYGFLWLVNTKK